LGRNSLLHLDSAGNCDRGAAAAAAVFAATSEWCILMGDYRSSRKTVNKIGNVVSKINFQANIEFNPSSSFQRPAKQRRNGKRPGKGE
jgi:hypothetical protein